MLVERELRSMKENCGLSATESGFVEGCAENKADCQPLVPKKERPTDLNRARANLATCLDGSKSLGQFSAAANKQASHK